MIDYTDGSDTICYAEMVGMPEYCPNIANMQGCRSTAAPQATGYYARDVQPLNVGRRESTTPGSRNAIGSWSG